MACPYFEPREPLPDPGGHESTLPLGGAWKGICRAKPGESPEVVDVAVRRMCNLGYARGRCARFPAADGPDAVRFSVASHGEGRLCLHYALERGHYPYACGVLEPGSPTAGTGSLIELQARAYGENYLRRFHAVPE